jgi:hypothetical protein
VNVPAGPKGFDESRILGQVREDAQLDLIVVRRDEHVARRSDERAPDARAIVTADGDVL